MSERLTGKVAVIIGAAAGQGLAIAKLFAAEGAKVVLADIVKEKLDKAVKEIKNQGYEAAGVLTDLGKEEDVESMIQFAVKTYDHLDILINNAGIMEQFQTVANLDDETLDKILAVDMYAPFYACRAAIKVMNQQDKGGVIVNTSSVGGLFGSRGGAAYTMAKHALLGLTKNIGATEGIYGKVRANAIAPGGVASEMPGKIAENKDKIDPIGAKAFSETGQAIMATTEQLANVALFLASEESSSINGAVLVADGGWTVR